MVTSQSQYKSRLRRPVLRKNFVGIMLYFETPKAEREVCVKWDSSLVQRLTSAGAIVFWWASHLLSYTQIKDTPFSLTA
jgi:hypothetical protein